MLENMVLPALEQGGYHYRKGVYIGSRPGGRRHKIDVLAWRDQSYEFLISLKWQQSRGTAEQKIPFEVICLADAVQANPNQKAYLVIGGEGWTLREFYLSGGLSNYLVHAGLVTIISLEGFVAKANGNLL